jgi:acyl-coenzyme A thioesterase PaaI-like protein
MPDSTPQHEPVADYAADLNMWLGRPGLSGYPADQEFLQLTEAMRRLQDRVAAARPTADVARRAAAAMGRIAAELHGFEVDEPHQVAGRLLQDPGRGQTLLPPFQLAAWSAQEVTGRIRFTRFHVGSNQAAHGGAISLVFDDLLGQLANAPGEPKARTAWLRVNYHRITPIEQNLDVRATVIERLGRKVTITGELSHGGDALATAEGLFIQLRPGQP